MLQRPRLSPKLTPPSLLSAAKKAKSKHGKKAKKGKKQSNSVVSFASSGKGAFR